MAVLDACSRNDNWRLVMQLIRWSVLALACAIGLPMQQAVADYYDHSRYDYCRSQAERVSGYYGPVPERYLPGGAGRGAVRGATAGVAIGAIAGGDRKDLKRAARRGAVVGAVAGAARRERARDDQRDRRYLYDLELNRCMDDYR
jgi:hypothetical protein